MTEPKLFVPKHVRQWQDKTTPASSDSENVSELEQKMQEKAAQSEVESIDLPMMEKLALREPWCFEGDWVIFGRYAGSRFKIEGGEVRLLNDDEILAKINNPEDIIHI